MDTCDHRAQDARSKEVLFPSTTSLIEERICESEIIKLKEKKIK